MRRMNEIVKDVIKANLYLDYPIFAFGSGRCGSTLLRSLVDNHPQVACWPFEFAYYVIYQDALKCIPKRHTVLDLFLYFRKVGAFQHIGKAYDGDLNSIKYPTDSIQADKFFGILKEWGPEEVSRKEFLQLIIYAFTESLNLKVRPRRWFATLTLPTSEALVDFPQCKAILLTRHPIDTYISFKRFYFKGAELSGRDKCAAYRLRAADSRFKWGLLETAISPILQTWQWSKTNWEDPRVRVMWVVMENLRENPERVMQSVSRFCGIFYRLSLIQPTFLGQHHYSNLSTGISSEAKILPQKGHDYSDLTEYELYWIGMLFHGISLKWQSRPKRIWAFFKPLKHEFPEPGGDIRWENRKTYRYLVRVARWGFALFGYVANRYVMLRFKNKK